MTEYSMLFRIAREDVGVLCAAVRGRVPTRVTSATHAFVECTVVAQSDLAALGEVHNLVDPLGITVHEIRVSVA